MSTHIFFAHVVLAIDARVFDPLAHLQRIMREGTGADRQLAVWESTGDVKAMVDHIVSETYEGLHVLV